MKRRRTEINVGGGVWWLWGEGGVTARDFGKRFWRNGGRYGIVET